MKQTNAFPRTHTDLVTSNCHLSLLCSVCTCVCRLVIVMGMCSVYIERNCTQKCTLLKHVDDYIPRYSSSAVPYDSSARTYPPYVGSDRPYTVVQQERERGEIDQGEREWGEREWGETESGERQRERDKTETERETEIETDEHGERDRETQRERDQCTVRIKQCV